MSLLRQSAAQGAQWNAAGTLFGSILSLAQLAILAQLLSPEDFGLMAMVLVAVALAQRLADAGVTNALIARQDLSRGQLSSLYWLSVGSGLSLCVLFELGAPLLVALYDEPRLLGPVRCLAAGLVLSAPGVQSQTMLERDLRFRTTAVVEALASALSAAVAITMAWNGHGVWALVGGQLVLAGSRSALFVAACWRRWRPAFYFRIADVREHIGFGAYQIGERMLGFLGQRADQLLLGVLVGPQALGYYNMAFNLAMQPVTRINPVLTRVAFPVLARVQHSPDKLREGYFTLRRVLTLVNAPALLGLVAVAPVLIPSVLGEAWRPSVVLVQCLAVMGLCRALGNPVGSLILARGRADLGFHWTLAFVLVQVPAIFLGAYLGGVNGVAIALVNVHLLFLGLEYRFLVRPLLGRCLAEYLGSVLPALGTAALMALVVAAVGSLIVAPWPVALTLEIATGLLVYAALIFWLFREQVRDCLGLVWASQP